MKLHLGCGPRYIPGWYHIDAVQFPHVDLRSAVDRIPQAADGSADVIYACHVLEHFSPERVPEVLREWHRILRPSGVLRVAVPDMEAVARFYVEVGDLALVRGLIWGRGNFLYNVHHTGFDFRSLAAVLELAKFMNPHRYNWWETEHADVDDFSCCYYPHMAHRGTDGSVLLPAEIKGRLLSLNMEATKP